MVDQNKYAINFTSYITERTTGFTGREWVFQAINEWLADPNGSRFFLLTGEPGSGKTAFAGRLFQFSRGTIPAPVGLSHLTPHFLSAVHFCSTRDTRWSIPQTFAESLAIQLAKRYPDYAAALAEKSEERQIHIEVRQHVEQGSPIGVMINHLAASGATPEEVFNRVVREPLEVLFQDGFNQQIVILVDALDEALVYSGATNIPSLLTQVETLPTGVRFILTSRPEIDVLRPLRRAQSQELKLTSGVGLTQSLQDIQRYLLDALKRNPALEEKLTLDLSRPTLIKIIQEKSDGNFLYVRYLLNMLLEQQEQISLTLLNTLPKGLDGIYLEFLERLVKHDSLSWGKEYAAILGTLAVAQVALSEVQLADLIGRAQTELRDILKRLHQLLDVDETLPASQRTYAIYHHSFIGFLLDEDRSEEYWCEAKKEHLRLAGWCEKGNLSIIWEDAKYSPGEQGRREYAREYYITHLYQAQEWQRLFEVLDEKQYGQGKMSHDPSMHTYIQDLDLGRQATIWEGWTVAKAMSLLPHLWQYTLLRCSLTSRAAQYPEEAFRLLVLLGRKQEALGLAELLTDRAKKVRVLQRIAEQVRQQASKGSEWIELFMRACDVARTIQSISKQAEVLSGLGTALIQAQQWEYAEYVIDTIQDSFQLAETLSALGTALIQAQQWKRASEMWVRAKRAIDIIQDRSRHARALSDLGMALAQAQQWEQAERIITAIQDDYWQSGALSALVTALAQAHLWVEAERVIDTIQGHSRQADVLSALVTALAQAHLWAEAERVIDTIQDSYQRARALRELGSVLVQAQQWEQASKVWAEAERVIDTIRLGTNHAKALRYLGLALAQAQQWAEAERVITKISGKSRLDSALSALATTLAQAQQWAEAERVIAKVQGRPEQTRALSALAMALTQAQQWAEAERVIGMITDSDEQVKALSALGLALAQVQQWERASKVWVEVKRVIEENQDGTQHAKALSDLGTALVQAQQWVEAERVIASITDSDEQVKAMMALGIALAQAQQWAEAERMITTIQDSSQQAVALMALGTALTQAQHWERASQVWVEAKHVIEENQDGTQHAKALSDLGTALIHAQQREHAFQIWAEAERIIAKIQGRSESIGVLSALSTALAQAQQWTEVEHVIGMLQVSDEQVVALSALGTALAQAQQWKRASQVWAEAERIIAKIQGSNQQAVALSDLGVALAQAQQWAEAERVIASITDSDEQVKALKELGTALASANEFEQLLHMIQHAWRQAETKGEALILFSIVDVAISRKPEIGIAFFDAFTWVDTFLGG